jgi:hypothetical protein
MGANSWAGVGVFSDGGELSLMTVGGTVVTTTLRGDGSETKSET